MRGCVLAALLRSGAGLLPVGGALAWELLRASLWCCASLAISLLPMQRRQAGGPQCGCSVRWPSVCGLRLPDDLQLVVAVIGLSGKLRLD